MPSAADMCLRHVAIIMDGNGRWAQARGLPRHEGHRAGVESARSVIEAAARAGVEVLTLYSFSTENWKRPAEEVAALMGLITHLLPIERETLMENGIRFRVIGDLARLPQDVVSELEQTQSATAGNSGMQLVVALNYGSRQEIVHAVQTLAASVQAGDRTPESIDAEAIADALWTKGLPDVDLLIRTAGEMRVSNYLLWQISYAEIVVDECCWPDFGAEGFTRAMEQFAQRRRTRGGLSADG
ncbi:MAG: polyprenyl diphosphate synthase [Phycisphaerales bacterium]|nr:polyprenyl diphosphate synthase [Phycisphaerales bacterium]